jgi:hypothetical protein
MYNRPRRPDELGRLLAGFQWLRQYPIAYTILEYIRV